jgi:hypothetical protein
MDRLLCDLVLGVLFSSLPEYGGYYVEKGIVLAGYDSDWSHVLEVTY